MYLKSLELQGFKSFPDRTVIRFSDGMTAIVGPNGSGKSNISDAIRWVLGEQSTKSLRGAKMEDVIFGGTAKRGPTGAAQVTLILDNTANQFPVDAAEVMVTRKYYRSGESEYYLNRKRVRLRDIRDVFMDTGLGHDGYSIIGQGRIDEILAVKSSDRREVFEEAAGVTRFRTRKEEAEHKLDQTAENLVRIRDIWSELNARSEPLKKQAETAEKYLELQDILRSYEISLWMAQLGSMTDARGQSEQACQQAKEKLEAACAVQKAYYERSEQLTMEIRQSDIKAEQIQAELSAAETEASDLSRRMAVLGESRRNAAENISLAKGQLEAQQNQANALQQQLQARKLRLDELGQHILQQTTALGQKQKEIDHLAGQINSGQNKTGKLRGQAEQYSAQVFAVQADQRAVQAQLEALEGRGRSVSDSVHTARVRAEQEQAAQQTMQYELDELRKSTVQAEAEQKKLRQQADDAMRSLAEARQEHTALTSQWNDSKNRIRMLGELQRDYEGFSRAVKLVMNQAYKGVRGPLSSLIHVPDRYVTAIETALGSAASNIIVECAEDGKKAIQMLKRRDGGRATFLPMDTIRPQYLKETGLQQQKGFCGIAADLADCEADYRDIVDNALGRTAVAENMDDALAIAKKYHNRFRIVTLDGQLIHAGGSMTGGSAGHSSGILSRANQLEQVKKRAREQENQLELLAANGRQLAQNAKDAESRAEKAMAELSERKQKLAALTAQAQQHQLLLESLRQAESQFRAEQDNAEHQRSQLQSRMAQLGQQEQQLSRENQQVVTALHEAESKTKQMSITLAAGQEELTAMQAALAQAQTERDLADEALGELQQMADTANQSAQSHVQRIREYTQAVKEAEQEYTQLEARKAQNQTRRENLQQQLQQCGQSRMRLEQNKTEIEKQARTAGNDIAALERRHAEAEAAVQRVQSEEQRILDKMWESYALTPTAARPIAHAVTDRAAEEKKAAELRRAVKGLGTVNVAAIAEYKELSERLAFLTQQKNDIEQAETDLRRIIGSLTEQMKQVFAASFAQLNQYFGETFREIFGGGSAELVLEDEADILSCGIEIRAAPPGKTVKSLSLLSGGEKAFVAIALYFAILKVRPTPFCVLDEIEAALDDVNVVRFAQYLRRLSDKTQFIVITHRRGTMEEADMLYGVTMQERGVSKLLMLNITEIEEQIT